MPPCCCSLTHCEHIQLQNALVTLDVTNDLDPRTLDSELECMTLKKFKNKLQHKPYIVNPDVCLYTYTCKNSILEICYKVITYNSIQWVLSNWFDVVIAIYQDLFSNKILHKNINSWLGNISICSKSTATGYHDHSWKATIMC